MKETFSETFKEESFRVHVSTCNHHVQQHGLVLMGKNTNITGDTQCHKPRLVP
jgi:hypothetical protein